MTIAIRKQPARSVADVATGTILATVDIAAPPERVFKALTTEEVTRWWGSAESYQTTKWTLDLRVGGAWRAEGKGKEGEFHVGGEVLELDPPRTIVKTWETSWDPGIVTKLAYRLEPIDGGTRLVVRHEGFGARAATCRDHAAGWERVLGWLAAHTTDVPETRRPYLLRLLSPRPTFMQDMTDAERKTMLQHGAYWAEHLANGTVVAFGPVLDPKGAWGVGIVDANEAEVAALEASDPALSIGMRYERLPMAVLRR